MKKLKEKIHKTEKLNFRRFLRLFLRVSLVDSLERTTGKSYDRSILYSSMAQLDLTSYGILKVGVMVCGMAVGSILSSTPTPTYSPTTVGELTLHCF